MKTDSYKEKRDAIQEVAIRLAEAALKGGESLITHGTPVFAKKMAETARLILEECNKQAFKLP